MSRFVTPETSLRVQTLMFGEFDGTEREDFLEAELARYVPQFVGAEDDEIAEFIRYQRAVYLEGKMPLIGTPVASFNPTFVDSVGGIELVRRDHRVYTRGSLKENGYRFQFHRGECEASAFTRQFTPYDLRMFPELQTTLKKLPVMIGDAELINKHHKHLAGFNRVELRIPGTRVWPKRSENGLSKEILAEYLADQTLFVGGKPIEDLEMTLSFHGLFAISHPTTWNKSRATQMKHLISLCGVPLDIERIDELLNLLEGFIEEHGLNARVVERQVIKTHPELAAYLRAKYDEGVEGICVAQSVRDAQGVLVVGPRSIKVKKYENIDCAVLGVYLHDAARGCEKEENIKGVLVGLYDEVLGVYLSVTKANLDPSGPQIKTQGQRDRLNGLRKEISELVAERAHAETHLYTLHDVFLMQGAKVLQFILPEAMSLNVAEVLEHLPRGHTLTMLTDVFHSRRKEFEASSIKKPKAAERFILEHLSFFTAIDDLDEKKKARFLEYFSQAPQIKALSKKLVRPQLLVRMTNPIIVETHVFDLKWGASPHPAGFHSWFGDSFCLSNCFVERVRHDKSSTTPYETVYDLLRPHTVRTKKKKK